MCAPICRPQELRCPKEAGGYFDSMRPPSKILVATDFSNASLMALRGARVLAQDGSPHLILAHVLAVDPLHEGDVVANTGMQKRLEADAHERLDALRKAELADVEHVTTALLRDKSVPDALCRLAKDEDIDVIVIATHGRTGLAHLLIGSVAERVVRHAPCPVLTVRSKRKD
jgi:nucleotide-binding universal stress UspA family protein